MRILLTSAPLYGHFFPMVPLAWALRSAGHQVRVAVPEDFVEAVTGAGLPGVASAPPTPFEEFMLRDRQGRPVRPAPDPAARLIGSGRAWGRLAARTLPGILGILDGFRPDLVVSEATEYAGPLAAAARHIPLVRMNWLSAMPEYRQGAAEELAPELDGLGLAGLPAADLALDVCPPGTEVPGPGGSPGPTPAAASRPIRYVPHNGHAVQPDWAWQERTRPRVCLTLGSMLPVHGRLDFPGKLAGLMTALTEEGAEVVVAVDEKIARGWNPLPPGVLAAGWLPLELVAPACDLLINHGGMGSLLTGAVAALPQLAMPQTADQFANAEWLIGTGSGLRLLPQEADTGAVVRTTRELLREPSYRERARAVSGLIAQQPVPAELVPTLEALIG